MILSTITGAIRGSFADFLTETLPIRTKRLVFVASLTARLKDADAVDSETLKKLNQVMALANSASALKLPIQLSKVIWRGRKSIDILKDVMVDSAGTTDTIGKKLTDAVDAMPAWLRYAEACDMEQDVRQLLENRSELLGKTE